MRLHLLSLPIATLTLLLSGCAGRDPAPERSALQGEAPSERERAALKAMTALEEALEEAGRRRGADREAAERRLGDRVEQVASLCQGTRLENKGWYLLASWRFQYGPAGDGALEALDRLDRCPLPTLKQTGRALRAQVLCRQDRLPAARRLAEAVVADIPQFQPVLDLVNLMDRRGGPAPDLPGLTRPTKPLLLIIAANDGEDTRFRLERLLAREDTRAWTPLLLMFDASPTALRDLPSVLNRPDLITARPRTPAEVTAWQLAWTPPSEFLVSAIAADGTLLATNLRVDDALPNPVPVTTIPATAPAAAP